MKIVFLHADFRVYWLPRLRYLNAFLNSSGHQLYIIEIAGAGSPYAFAQRHRCDRISSWICLFPDKSMEDISPTNARKSITQTLDQLNPDIVFAGAIAYPSGAAAVQYCRVHKIPLVIFDNARLLDVPRNRLINFIKRCIYKNVDAVLIPAPSHIPDFEFWGFFQRQMYMGLNVVDNAYWKRLSLNQQMEQDVQKKFALPEKYILGVGRQIAKKNWLSALKAYSLIESKFSLILVGNGPERPVLEEFIKQSGLYDKIQILEFQPPEILAILYKKAIATILPSYAGETWGLTINEAMACGSPVIVSTQCGCCETLCKDGVTGFQVTTEPDSIANAFLRLSALSPEHHKTMRRNAEALVANWGVEKFSQSVLQAAETLTSYRIPGFYSLLSRIIVSLWKGRYRPV